MYQCHAKSLNCTYDIEGQREGIFSICSGYYTCRTDEDHGRKGCNCNKKSDGNGPLSADLICNDSSCRKADCGSQTGCDHHQHGMARCRVQIIDHIISLIGLNSVIRHKP